MVKKEANQFCHGRHLHTRGCCKGLALPISFPIGAVPLILPRGLFYFYIQTKRGIVDMHIGGKVFR